jgi:hypothetical protein
LERKYIQYGEESISKFLMEKIGNIMQALHVPLWIDETMKGGYQRFINNRVYNALWNAEIVLIKYGKEHPAGDASFEEVILKENLFSSCLQSFANIHN